MIPQFPMFKPIRLEDLEFIQQRLWHYQPTTSELTFTNLFIWRTHYGFQWTIYKDWLIVLSTSESGDQFALPPIGPAPRTDVSRAILEWLRTERKATKPRIERVDSRLVSELQGTHGLAIEPTREHFDYIYKSNDLIELAGNKYHAKRNHIHSFLSSHTYTYDALSETYMKQCLELTEVWCGLHRCEEDLNLLGEWEAIGEAFANLLELRVTGGVIIINGKVEAFTIGELLNERTAVVHIEKANPDIKGLYALINQQCVENSWRDIPYINREQDLGEPGLRKAKLSYHPDHLIEKYRVTLAEESTR